MDIPSLNFIMLKLNVLKDVLKALVDTSVITVGAIYLRLYNIASNFKVCMHESYNTCTATLIKDMVVYWICEPLLNRPILQSFFFSHVVILQDTP